MPKTAAEPFESFTKSSDKLWILNEEEIIFRSDRSGIAPIMDYLETAQENEVIISAFDRVVGNAAALLFILMGCHRIMSVTGSEMAASSLNQNSIPFNFQTTVPFIINRRGDGMCPFEKASLGMAPRDFYQLVKAMP